FDLMWCDVVAFDRAVAAEQFSEALDLYRGDLLEGFFIPDAGEVEHWQESERARLQQAAARGAQTLVKRCETEGDLSTAAEWARRAVRHSPHDEEPLRRLIALLDRLGDRAGAVEAYEDFAKRLAADLETEPAAETKALLAAVRARQSAAPVELPSAALGYARPPTPQVERRRTRHVVWPLAIAAALVWLVLSQPSDRRGRLWPRSVTGQIRSLAVLPLTNLSGDSLESWYADGLTEALTTDLGRLRVVRVVSRDAAARYKGKRLPDIARGLEVDAVVEGGLQVSGGRVRVDLRLVSAVAVNLCERAVARDPDFAAAYAELSHAYALRVQQLVREDTVALERAQVAAEKALRLNPDLAEGHFARAFLLWGPGGRFSHQLAVQEDRRAL